MYSLLSVSVYQELKSIRFLLHGDNKETQKYTLDIRSIRPRGQEKHVIWICAMHWYYFPLKVLMFLWPCMSVSLDTSPIPVMPSPTAWPNFLISVSYGIPSILLYLLTFSIILRHRKIFDSSFFHLYIYDGLMNLFTYLVGLFKSRISSITCYDCLLGKFYRNIGLLTGR